ncbi:MAG: 5-oxoprolinase (ATP-hydrolyzing) subunit [Mycobacteriales bacterium]|jgi:biotin-dependent carboxylase-like uncharacterized protein
MGDVLTVHRAGIAAVTDLGRAGLTRVGIPGNGAADQYSAAVANLLAGNTAGDPLIEITATAFGFTATRAVRIAVTGAPADITIGGRPGPMWRPIQVAAGDRVGIDRIRDGLRSYVAVHGSLDVPRALGSCAPDPLLRVGGWLRRGSQVALAGRCRPGGHRTSCELPVDTLAPRFGSPWTIDVTGGPDAGDFADLDGTLLAADYAVSPASNHIGLRLSGPAPARTGPAEVLSRGVPVGAVEVPPSGELIVLLRGRPVTAGYPVVAVATRVAQGRLGQVRPGHTLRFRHRPVEDAVAAYRRQRHTVHTLAAAMAGPGPAADCAG